MNIEEMEAHRVTMRWVVYGIGVVMAGLVALAYSCEEDTPYEKCVDACYKMKCADGAAACIDACHKVQDAKHD